ncbi:MAG: bifunctional pyr operon transcriptional regulator/uracil phosphoribosyltransferase PyrR [Clostridia bacterium]|nr:bifunctional pyr operon transcriptional regulator/uracil phosphoribosyltransferase PyrR [Clostridia bacterium]MDR3643649.1 bifunctional pyr operon transcriptional regulator/uracil phosphoribosyltransferase PyrR [Clostridia bacterium]
MQREKAEIMDEKAIQRAVARISYEIVERNHGVEGLCLIGIRRRGATLAKLIAAKLLEIEGAAVDTGFIDITPYRDDHHGPARGLPAGNPFGFDVEGRRVVLIDDVIFTGRSVRAAIEAVIRQGRPESLELAVLIDRGHRELPIRPDYIGKNVPTSRSESVDVMLSEYDGINRVAIMEDL